MSDDTDFIALYDELGLDAECGMASFKRAYRRRVARLHPDHLGEPADLPRLQRLNRMYAAALEFHRIHGRLPGASRASGPRPASPAEAAETPRAPSSAAPEPHASVAGSPRRRRYLLMLALVALLLYWLGAQRTSVPTLDPEGPGDAVHPGWRMPEARRVTVGMDSDQVRRILGEPVVEHTARWDYGLSWVEFECGKVVGWYSSPAHPLRVDEDSADAHARSPKRPPHC